MKVALLDDFHPIVYETFSSWSWDIIDGKKWTAKDFQLNAASIEEMVIRSKFKLTGNELKFTKKLEFIARPGYGLENIDLKTLQSKIVTDLYFAGEVLDIDGLTGGYNFQSAWSTGFIAGKLAGKFY